MANPRHGLEDRSKRELYNLAKKHDVTGRSTMNTPELASAVRAAQK
ncbi:MAG: hypothetical protein ACFCVE_13320 [Phycisphaerae bacterium]